MSVWPLADPPGGSQGRGRPYYYDEQLNAADVLPGTAAAYYGTLSKKLAKQRYYKLPSDDKRVAPCVECAERPGVNGPTCPVCKPNSPLPRGVHHA